MKYIFNQINEIKMSPVLKLYGVLHFWLITLTCIFWLNEKVISYWIAKHTTGICWPGVSFCQSGHLFSQNGWQNVFILLALASFILSFLFLKNQTVKYAFIFLIILNFIKFGIVFIDYRLRLNQHIMCFWLLVAFLFLPKKIQIIPILIACFYFAAGLLKLNYEWISGSALYIKPWLIPDTLVPLACLFVVVLEVILIWGLFVKKYCFQWLVLFSLIIFHISSFNVVGFYYPTLMFLILTIFPLIWLHNEYKINLHDLFIDKKIIIFILLFFFTQFSSYLFYNDPDLTGHGRLLRLHMFDSLAECEGTALFKRENGTTYTQKIVINDLPQRIKCDPQVYKDWGYKKCSSVRIPKFTDFSLSLVAKRKSDRTYIKTLNIESMCSL